MLAMEKLQFNFIVQVSALVISENQKGRQVKSMA
jgi:hypothetical protein